MESGSCSLCNDSFTINTAGEGAAIYKDGGILEICQTNITNNFASNEGNLHLTNVTLMSAEGVNFINNIIEVPFTSLLPKYKLMELQSSCMYNLGILGEQLQPFNKVKIYSTQHVWLPSVTKQLHMHGGGIYLAQSNLHVYHPFELTDNKASEYGGGVYASRSQIEFKSEQTQTLQITSNTALNGGALCAIASNVHISKTSIDFSSNTAITNGGALYLGQNSKIWILKNEPDYVWDDNVHIRLDFTQ